MIQLASESDHLDGANFIVTINCREKFAAETAEEVWRIIGEQPFGSGHIVTSPKGLPTYEFIPF